jgi:hypothetical protein
MRKVIVLLVMLVLAVRAPAQSSDGDIRGFVTDRSGKGIAGVQIDILNRAGATEGRGTVTDPDGRYALINIRAGSYNVKYSNSGYGITIVNSVIVSSDKTTEIEVVLKPSTEGKEVKVVEYVKPFLGFQAVKIE